MYSSISYNRPNHYKYFQVTLLFTIFVNSIGFFTVGFLNTGNIMLLNLLMAIFIVVNRLINPVVLTYLVTVYIFFITRMIYLNYFPSDFLYIDNVSFNNEDFSSTTMLLILVTLIFTTAVIIFRSSMTDKIKTSAVLPFSRIAIVGNYEKAIFYLFPIFQVAILILKFTTGVGMRGFNNLTKNTDSGYLYVIFYILIQVGFIFPAYYFILKRREKIILINCIIFFIGTLLDFSKASLLYILLPVFLGYVVYKRNIPPKLIKYTAIIGLFTLAFLGLIIGYFRVYLAQTIFHIDISDSSFFNEINIIDSLTGMIGRLGSSFDVLYSIMIKKASFLSQVNFVNEVKILVNGFFPGQPFAVSENYTLTEYVPVILRGYELEFLNGYAENVNVFSYLYILFPSVFFYLGFFILGLGVSIWYYVSRSLSAKLYILSFLIINLSNSGGLTDLVRSVVFFYLAFLIYAILSKLFFNPNSVKKHAVVA